MSSADPFFRLPTELCCAILRDWLLMDSVVRFDSAVCNAEKRPLLLNTIFRSSHCVLNKGSSYESQLCRRDAFDWLCLRKVRDVGLCFDWNVNDMVCEYFQAFGSTIRKLEFFNCNAIDYLRLVSAHCNQIVCLSVEEAIYVSALVAAKYLHSSREIIWSDFYLTGCNLKALDLSRTRITDFHLEQILTQCLRITHLCISACKSIGDACGSIIANNLKHLQYLDITNTNLSDVALVTISECNHFSLEEIHMYYCEEMTGFGFITLLKKCTNLWSVHITYCEEWFNNLDFSLLCNLTELCILNLDEDDSYLYLVALHCKKLQRFLIYYEVVPECRLFLLTELTAQRLPDLKILALFCVSKNELQEFRLMRPEVEITTVTDVFDPTLFSLNWYMHGFGYAEKA